MSERVAFSMPPSPSRKCASRGRRSVSPSSSSSQAGKLRAGHRLHTPTSSASRLAKKNGASSFDKSTSSATGATPGACDSTCGFALIAAAMSAADAALSSREAWRRDSFSASGKRSAAVGTSAACELGRSMTGSTPVRACANSSKESDCACVHASNRSESSYVLAKWVNPMAAGRVIAALRRTCCGTSRLHKATPISTNIRAARGRAKASRSGST